MVCIFCNEETSVVNSRPRKGYPAVWRRRQCGRCKTVFSTREKPDLSSQIKFQGMAGDLEPFSEDKLFLSINDSLSHRNDSLSHSRQLTDTLMARLFPHSDPVFQREEIIAAAYKIIRRFDIAAATYYKSHHPLGNQLAKRRVS